jgi:anti-sigma factor RsiW
MNMRRRLNSCRNHRENVSLLASGALPEAEQASVRDHLAHCAPCREYYEELARLSGEFKQWVKTEPPVEAGAAFRARWMRSIEAADAPWRASLPALISQWGEWLWPSPVAWGALAAVWVCLLSIQWAMSAQRAAGHEMARSPSNDAAVTFAQRQRELASLLESLTPPQAPSRPDQPRPRSQRRVESVTT